MKSFKYFDLNGNGTMEPSEFAKAIEKVGIMIPTKAVSIILLGLLYPLSKCWLGLTDNFFFYS
mgnify:CR=1 FL=1